MMNCFCHKLARIISHFSIPLIPLAVTIIVINYSVAPDSRQFWLWTLIELLFLIIIPLGYVWYEYKKGRITDIQLVKRQERLKPLTVALLAAIMGMFILYYLTASREIIIFGLVYLINGLVVVTITRFWKISVHLAVLTACIVGLTLVVAKWMWCFLLLLPLVGWARVHVRRHSLAEVIIAPLVSALITIVIFYLLGYF